MGGYVRKTDKSQALFKRAVKCLSGGVNSPVRAFKSVGGTPLYIQRGEGAYIFDADGNKYLDFCCSWGPLILGHAHPAVLEALKQTASLGASFGTTHENEVVLAEKIKRLCPHLELLRFVSSGTEAVMSAIRLARAFTKRDKIIKFSGCYHGHTDYLLVSAGSGLATLGIPSSEGVPLDFAKHTLVAPLNDVAALEEIFSRHENEIAAVIIEPIPANNGLLIQPQSYLEFLREITKRHGALLIFDEVISGFRVAPGGATERYGIVPDLSTYGKVVGGGLPVGAFGGRADIMGLLAPLGPVYQAGTLSGNPLALACGIATLEYLEKNDRWAKLERKTIDFVQDLKRATSGYQANIAVIGSIFWISLQPSIASRAEEIDAAAASKYAILFHRALDAGIYLAPSAYEVGFVSAAHSREDLSMAAQKLSEIIKSL
jgi:glutamate-1-semialdehyde 2,1-aminomutase